jgi:hypothetical protein
VNRSEDGTTVFAAPTAKVWDAEDPVLVRKRLKKEQKNKRIDFYRFQMRETKAKRKSFLIFVICAISFILTSILNPRSFTNFHRNR